MTTDTTPTATQIADALRENDMNVSKAAEQLGMSRTTFRRHRDANADEIAALLAQNADDTDVPADDDEAAEIAGAETDDPADDDPAEAAADETDDQGDAAGPTVGEPAATAAHCDLPGCGPDGECCGRKDCGHCNQDGHLDPALPAAKPAPAPASTGAAAKKRVVAEAIIAAAAQIAAKWEHDEITRDEATAWIGSWMNYLPGGVWDSRLGERSGAGRRAK